MALSQLNTLSTPLSTATKLTSVGEPMDARTPGYAQLVGSLLYLSVCTRPDIAQAVGALARYMSKPSLAHWQAAKGVLRYLAGTANYGITFGAGGPGLEAYCDADYAGDIDTRRSTTAYVFILNGGAISWSSRLQQTVAASTTEAEYMAAAAAIKEALWLRTLLGNLGQPIQTIPMLADSQGAIKLLKNPVFSMRSKHIDVIYHFARERVARNDVSFSYIKTDHMVAEVLDGGPPGCTSARQLSSLLTYSTHRVGTRPDRKPDGQTESHAPHTRASWQNPTVSSPDPMPSVSTLQLAATSGSHPPSGHSPMHAYNPLHFALFVILS